MLDGREKFLVNWGFAELVSYHNILAQSQFVELQYFIERNSSIHHFSANWCCILAHKLKEDGQAQLIVDSLLSANVDTSTWLSLISILLKNGRLGLFRNLIIEVWEEVSTAYIV